MDDLGAADPLEPLEELFRDLRASADGLSGREAARRLEVSGPDGTGPAGQAALARQATTVTWLGIVACQVGTAFAVRTDHASLRQVGLFSNKLLLGAPSRWSTCPPCTACSARRPCHPGSSPSWLPFPFIVWGADEIRRWVVRRRPPGAGRSRPSAGISRQGQTIPRLAFLDRGKR